MRVKNITYSSIEDTSQQEQIIYDRLLYWVQNKTADRFIHDFRCLFIEAKGYEDKEVRLALDKIVNAKGAEENFNFFFNRCCHIPINHWQMQPQLQTAIRDLLDQFNYLLPPESVYSRTSKRLRRLVKNFSKSEQFLKLQRLAVVIDEKNSNSKLVGNLITRYPYLYEHCLLSEDSSYGAKKAIQQIQAQHQHQFELDLSKYVIHQLQLARKLRDRQLSPEEARIIKSVKNPTLLTEPELGSALKQFIGKVERGYTYGELSQSFLNYNKQVPSYKSFKNNLYEYLISSIDGKYGKHQFNEKLYKKLQATLSQCDAQQLNEGLVVRTGSQLMKFLVVESNTCPNHYVFVDLITNLGATQTVGLLLKLALICRKLKPYLEKRFSILFSHYEPVAKEGVPWLIRSLENLNIAFSIYFGKVDLSCLKQIM